MPLSSILLSNSHNQSTFNAGSFPLDFFEECLFNYEKAEYYNHGLYNGKTGLSIIYFWLHRLHDIKRYREKAESLLDNLSNDIVEVDTWSFDSGLAGIGWGIEYLFQNKFIDGNSDEILENHDDEAYKSIIYNNDEDLSLERGILGKILYYLRRLLAKNYQTKRYRDICNQECLFILLERLKLGLTNNDIGLVYKDFITDSEYINVARAFILLSRMTKKGFRNDVIKFTLLILETFITERMRSDVFSELSLKARCYLSYSVIQAGKNVNDPSWINIGLNQSTTMADEINALRQSDEIGYYLKGILSTFDHSGNNFVDRDIKLSSITLFTCLSSITEHYDIPSRGWLEAYCL